MAEATPTVLFDVDGTLVDLNYHRAIAEAELREAGATTVFEDLTGLRQALDDVPFSSP